MNQLCLFEFQSDLKTQTCNPKPVCGPFSFPDLLLGLGGGDPTLTGARCGGLVARETTVDGGQRHDDDDDGDERIMRRIGQVARCR